MRFEKIECRNYRQYRKLEMRFPKSKGTDLHVIVASNGVGKTNMLNAICWCLYGKEPHLGDAKDSLTICNLAALQEAKDNNSLEINVSVAITASVSNEVIVFERTVAVMAATSFVKQQVFKAKKITPAGDTEILAEEEAKAIIEEYLPQKIRQYFFFDGEQLFNYFGSGQDTTHVKDSIHQIAQIGVVTNTKAHLDVIINDYNKAIGKKNPAIDELNQRLQTEKDKHQHFLEQIDSLKQSIEQSEQIVADMNLKIAGTESVVEDNERYIKAQKRQSELEQKYSELQHRLRALVRKYYVVLMLYDVNCSTAQFIQDKYDNGQLPPSVDIDLIKKSLSSHECLVCKSSLSASSIEYLQSIIDKYQVSTAVSHKLMEMKNDVSRAVRSAEAYKKERAALFQEIHENEESSKRNGEEIDTLYGRISGCSSVEQIALWMEQRRANEGLIKENLITVGSYTAQAAALEVDIGKIQAEIDKAIGLISECAELREELSFAQRARDVLASVEQEITTDVRKQMETETMAQFAKLIWKQNTYGRIELSENYQLHLYHKITGNSCLGSCSAAERELLALAFTIALHKVSGHESPLFIDTPVGRVSDDNRENFAKSLIDVSNCKQLILAFTPSEFSEEISRYFDVTVLSSRNQLKIDVAEETTQEV